MPESEVPAQRKRIGKIVSVAIPAAALITGLLVINETTGILAPTTQRYSPISSALLRS